jgi:chromosome segregation ATPase
MQLTTWERREVIEDLLDLQIFTSMNLVLRERLSLCVNKRHDIRNKKELTENSLKLWIEHRARQYAQTEVDVEEKVTRIAAIDEQLADITENIRAGREETEALMRECAPYPNLENKRNEYVDLRTRIAARRSIIRRDISFFENHAACPTCSQQIDEVHRSEMIALKHAEVDEIDHGFLLMEKKEDELEQQLKAMTDIHVKISTIRSEITILQSKYSSLSEYASDLSDDIRNIEKRSVSDDDDRIAKLTTDVEGITKQLDELSDEFDILTVAGTLLKDDGIKAKIVKQYIPVINRLISKYMTAMDFMCKFELDENFNEKILSRYMDEFSYESFSEGQKQRIDLALLFTWRAIAKIRNAISTNLLILDEVFDRSLDDDGVDYVTGIIKQLSKDSKVIVISHKDQILDKFHDIVKFELRKNFSEMVH